MDCSVYIFSMSTDKDVKNGHFVRHKPTGKNIAVYTPELVLSIFTKLEYIIIYHDFSCGVFEMKYTATTDNPSLSFTTFTAKRM